MTEVQRLLSDKQEQEGAMLQVLMRVEQEQNVTEDARRFAEQDAAAQRYAAQVLQVPPTHLPYLPGESSSSVVDRSLQVRESIITMLKFHLGRAQNRMKQRADCKRSFREFIIGDYVYLKLQPYRQHSLKGIRLPHKLSPKFYGPFRVQDRVGSITYKLELPAAATIHNVFHVSQLKLCPRADGLTAEVPQYWADVGSSKEPESILDKKVVKRKNTAATKILVKWKGLPPDQATWEFYQDFTAKFPTFDP